MLRKRDKLTRRCVEVAVGDVGDSLSTSLGEGVHLENGVKSGLGPVKSEARVSNDSQSIAEGWRPFPRPSQRGGLDEASGTTVVM